MNPLYLGDSDYSTSDSDFVEFLIGRAFAKWRLEVLDFERNSSVYLIGIELFPSNWFDQIKFLKTYVKTKGINLCLNQILEFGTNLGDRLKRGKFCRSTDFHPIQSFK